MDRKTNKRLSSFMTKILRHSPGNFGVDVNEQGYANINELIQGMKRDQHWNWITEETIAEIAATSEKQRFEIKGDKIRARYGHSYPVIQEKATWDVPAILYHGTSKEKLVPIIEQAEGIKPMSRQYVHLSETKHFSTLAAKRRKKPCLLKIDTKKAASHDCSFYFAGNEVWLSTAIDPAAIISVEGIE